MFVIRSKENLLKEKILALRKREERLKEKEKEIEVLKMSMNLKGSEEAEE